MVYLVKTKDESCIEYEIGLFFDRESALSFVRDVQEKNQPYFIYIFEDNNGKLSFRKKLTIINNEVTTSKWYN